MPGVCPGEAALLPPVSRSPLWTCGAAAWRWSQRFEEEGSGETEAQLLATGQAGRLAKASGCGSPPEPCVCSSPFPGGSGTRYCLPVFTLAPNDILAVLGAARRLRQWGRAPLGQGAQSLPWARGQNGVPGANPLHKQLHIPQGQTQSPSDRAR